MERNVIEQALAEEGEALRAVNSARFRVLSRMSIAMAAVERSKGEAEGANTALARHAVHVAQELTSFARAMDKYRALERSRRTAQTAVSQVESGLIEVGE
jgi:hypothetical protein